MELTISVLDDQRVEFPPVHRALTQPDGLLAIGGNLEVDTLLSAYRQGIFPWFGPEEPILWWSPSPRMVFIPGELHVSRSLKRTLRKAAYRVSFDHHFNAVMQACAEVKRQTEGTWITNEMISAYQALHLAGHAHSVEVWNGAQLVGGLYGVSIGRVFFGESMFSTESNTSKIAITALSQQLAQWGFVLCDCQVHSDHLESLGAWLMDRTAFIQHLDDYCPQSPSSAHWKQEWQWIDPS